MREIEVKLRADNFKDLEKNFKELETLGLSRNNEETKGYDTQIYELETKK